MAMSIFQNRNAQIGTAIGVGASMLAVYAIHTYRRKQDYRSKQGYWNSPFVEAGRVDRLFVYPIKSCRGVETSFVDCTVRGTTNGYLSDREFLIIDELNDGMFLTARTYPKLVLIEVDKDTDTLFVKFPDSRTVEVNLVEVKSRNDVRKARLHGDTRTDGLDCGDEIGQALTEYLKLEGKRSLRLIQFSPNVYTERDQSADQKFWVNPMPPVKDRIMYADKTSYTINTTKSLADLNERLIQDGISPVDIRNFRPSIVIAETNAFDEDTWLEVRIGDAEFTCFLPCTRCVLTTVDPNQGVANKEVQPLKKLQEYRLAPGILRKQFGNRPIFGVHLALKRAGRIRVGDTVFIRRKPSPF